MNMFEHTDYLGIRVFKKQLEDLNKLTPAGYTRSQLARTALHYGLIKLKKLDALMLEKFILASERDLTVQEFGIEILQDADAKIMEQE